MLKSYKLKLPLSLSLSPPPVTFVKSFYAVLEKWIVTVVWYTSEQRYA